jgi:hypothetical protein
MELFLDSDGDGMEQLGDEPSESVREWRFMRAAEELTVGTAGDTDGGCFGCSLAVAGAADGCFGCSFAVATAADGSFGCSLAVAVAAAADGLLLAGLSPAGPLMKKPCARSFILSLTWTEDVSGLSAASGVTSEAGFSARPLCAPLSLLTRSADLADGLADCRRSRGLMRRPGHSVIILLSI